MRRMRPHAARRHAAPTGSASPKVLRARPRPPSCGLSVMRSTSGSGSPSLCSTRPARRDGWDRARKRPRSGAAITGRPGGSSSWWRGMFRCLGTAAISARGALRLVIPGRREMATAALSPSRLTCAALMLAPPLLTKHLRCRWRQFLGWRLCGRRQARQVGADLPQAGRGSGVIGGLAGGLGPAVGEVPAGDALDLG